MLLDKLWEAVPQLSEKLVSETVYSDSEPSLWLNLIVAPAEPPVRVVDVDLINELELFVVKDWFQSTPPAGVDE